LPIKNVGENDLTEIANSLAKFVERLLKDQFLDITLLQTNKIAYQDWGKFFCTCYFLKRKEKNLSL